VEIRCEKCHTEYELDDARLSEAGVTVKCTNCGNLFKIRKKTLGEPTTLGLEGGDDRLWLLRSTEGTVRHFRELKTLQQWIVERKVSREHEISRSGEVWKRLGDITELSSFFSAVEEAHGIKDTSAKDRAPTLAGPPAAYPVPPPVPPPPPPEPVVKSRAATVTAASPPAPIPHAPFRADTVPAAPPPVPAAASRETWRGTPVTGQKLGDDLAGSPLAGMMTSSEPAWTQSGRPQPSGANLPKTQVITLDERDELFTPRRSSSLPLFAIVGAVAALSMFGIWWFALRVPGEQAATTVADAAVAVAPVATTPDAKVVATAPVVPDAAPTAPLVDPFTAGMAKFDEDTPAAYAEAETIFTAIKSDDAATAARALGWLALDRAAWAQALSDQAALMTDPARIKALEGEAAIHRKMAEKLARDGQKRLEGIAEPLVALAEVLRQKGKLDEAVGLLDRVGDGPEALYIRGLVRASGGKPDATALLEQAIAQREKSGRSPTHVQARWRLALLLATTRPDDAKAQLRTLLQAQPQHDRAQLLLSRLEAPPTDPGPVTGVKPPDGDEAEPEGYEKLVQRGDRRAENGDCSGASRDYERALDVRPSGVEALTGLGYCYLDGGQYGRAMANFRAALGVSSRFGEAIIGLAEAYRYQGMKEEAAAQYRKYLEIHAGGPKAAMARRQLDALGVPKPEDKPPEPKPEDKPPEPKPEDKPPETPPEKPPEPAPEAKPPEPKPPEPVRPPPKVDPNAPNVPAPDSPGGP
jgi:predicted Zn finger-like uncharacterized protein